MLAKKMLRQRSAFAFMNYFGGLLSRLSPEGLPEFLLGQPPLPFPKFVTSQQKEIMQGHQE
jgi:hypothetical protein